jgi:hypothetical protein
MKRSTFVKAGMAALAPSFFMVMVMAACLTIGVGSGSGGSGGGGSGSDSGGSSDGGNSGGGSDSGVVTWTAVSDSTFGGSSIDAIAWGGGKFVAVGNRGKIAYSADGVTWTAVSDSTFGEDNLIEGIAWGGAQGKEKFVAVGYNSTRAGKMAYSADGITWTAVSDTAFRERGNESKILGIAWGGAKGKEKFVALGDKNIAYSADGITWTAVSDSTIPDWYTYSIAWGGVSGQEKFVAGGEGGKMAYSADGITWTVVRDSPPTGQILDIGWGGAGGQEKFVAVGDQGHIVYSADGVTWTKVVRDDDIFLGKPDNFGMRSVSHISDIAWGGAPGQEKFVAADNHRYNDSKMAYWDGAVE